ncbi:uncharacterized protein LOC113520807 [Galleria mellonella]|uniref:Uncharacterized protein LOC113520807 n=1 Tax=Galleria mellonella TaxID=7137 RepID=A0A6J3BXT9_GALME|nr:uncharacterized protein LOC113520807 [Galleria mellonella]
MGCVCCSLSSFVSILLDALERISLCTVCAMLTCCLLFTIISVMVLGIGIGYHYCFVSNSVESMAKAAKAAGALRSGPETVTTGNAMRAVDRAVKRGFAHRVVRREADTTTIANYLNDTSNFYRKVSSINITNITNI